MKYFLLGGLTLSAAVLLSGCLGSSVPGAKDVEGELKQYWAGCKMVRPTDIKKLNGIPQGEVYKIQFSYKLEYVADIPEEVLWASKLPPALPTRTPGMTWEEQDKLAKEAEEIRRPVLVRQNKFWEENCPGFMGEVFRRIAISPSGEAIIYKPARKGEGVVLNAEWAMVKSENGWISR